jgi:hypothetical protein
MGTISIDFNATDQLLILIFYIHQILQKKSGAKWESASVIYRLQEGLQLRREVLYNTLTEFGIPMKLV